MSLFNFTSVTLGNKTRGISGEQTLDRIPKGEAASTSPKSESAGVTHQQHRPGLAARLVVSLAVACLFLLLMYPWGEVYYPEGNPLRGPLWLLKSQGAVDKAIGIVVAGLLSPLQFACVVNRNRVTISAAVAGAIMWVAFGIWLTQMAVI